MRTIQRCWACASIFYWLTAVAVVWKPFDPAVISLVELGRQIELNRRSHTDVLEV